MRRGRTRGDTDALGLRVLDDSTEENLALLEGLVHDGLVVQEENVKGED